MRTLASPEAGAAREGSCESGSVAVGSGDEAGSACSGRASAPSGSVASGAASNSSSVAGGRRRDPGWRRSAGVGMANRRPSRRGGGTGVGGVDMLVRIAAT